MQQLFQKDIQYYKFCFYGFFKNLRFFEPFLILFFLEKNITFLQIGIIYSTREVLINILEIPSGILADIFGRKKTLIISFFFYITSFAMFFFTHSFFSFLMAISFYAMGDSFRSGNHKTMIFEYLRIHGWNDQRAHYYGHTRSWSQFGSAISSLIAAAIVFYSGNYQSIFIISVIPYILDLILISSYPRELDKSIESQNISSVKSGFKQIINEFTLSLKNPSILRAVANLSIHSGFHRSIKDYLQPVIQSLAISLPVFLYYTDTQRSSILIGIIYFIVYILTSLTTRKAGYLKDRIQSTSKALNITMFMGFILALISGIFYHYGFFLVSIIFYILIYLIENLRNPIGVGYVSELYQDHILSTALSLNSQSKSLLAAIFAPILGFIADYFGVGIALAGLSFFIIIAGPFFTVKPSK